MNDDRARTELSFLARRGSVYTVATAIQLSVYLLVLPAVTRTLPAGEFGTLTTALVVVQILTYVAALGFPYALTLDYFDRDVGPNGARRLALWATALAAVVAAVADLTGPWWSAIVFDKVPYGPALRIAVWSAVPFASLLASQAFLRSADRAARFVVITLTGTVGAQFIGLVSAWASQPTADTFMVGYGLALSTAAVVGLLTSRRIPSDGEQVDGGAPRAPTLLRRALALGVPTVPHAIAMYLLVAGDRIVIERSGGMDAVARYQVAYLVGALGITLAGSINNAWGPLVYGTEAGRRWKVLNSTEVEIVAVVAFVTACLALAAPVLLTMLAPESYDTDEIVGVTAVVAMCAMPYVTYLADAHVIFFERRPWVFAWTTPLAAALNLAMAAVLFRVAGLVGAAAASLVAYLAMAAMAAWARRALIDERRSWGRLAPWWLLAGAGATLGAILPGSAFGLTARAALCLLALLGALDRLRRMALGGSETTPLL